MKYSIILIGLFLFFQLLGCREPVPKTIGDPDNAGTSGYQPIDPLPVKISIETGRDTFVLKGDKVRVTNKRLMANLPDETMRLAIGQIDGKGNVSYTSSKIDYAGSSYNGIRD